ncbi:MAG TPA: hypothetical protein VMD75_18410 [Candidatus Binataceae bacterium]|nr:hypothetical protein [Candidatus Binataceae bacterium]
MNDLKIPAVLSAVMVVSLMLMACQQSGPSLITHKLVVTGNQHAVPLYPDEQAYLNTSRMKQEGGVEGMAGNVKQQFTAKEIDNQTPVKIVTADDNGAVITVVDGPMKGQTGFVAKQNID